MRTFLIGIAGVFGLLLPFSGEAQVPNLGQPGLNAAMTKLFGKNTAFSAKTLVRVLDKSEKETMSLSMNFAFLDSKIRMDVDLGQLKSKDMSPQILAPLKQAGMDKLVSVVRPDKRLTLVIYPAIQCYAELPMSNEEATEYEQSYKIDKTPLGQETLDGHACEKSKVNITDGRRHQETLVWNAPDVKGFPIQMQLLQPEGTVLMRYRDVQFKQPEAKLFDPPAGYTKYDSMEKLMQGAMMKMMGGK